MVELECLASARPSVQFPGHTNRKIWSSDERRLPSAPLIPPTVHSNVREEMVTEMEKNPKRSSTPQNFLCDPLPDNQRIWILVTVIHSTAVIRNNGVAEGRFHRRNPQAQRSFLSPKELEVSAMLSMNTALSLGTGKARCLFLSLMSFL